MSDGLNTLKAFDPGSIRLEQVIKSGLAMVTALLLTLAVLLAAGPALAAAAAMFSLLVAFISFVSVNEVKTEERKRTLLLASLCYIVGPFAAGSLRPYLLAAAILLLALMFLSFYLRRYGVRTAELGMSLLFAYYFSLLFGATLDTAWGFAAGAVVAIASVYCWQFVIRPYSPERYLRQAAAAFNSAVMDAVDACAQQLTAPTALTAPTSTSDEPLAAAPAAAALKRVHAARQAVEVQLIGLSAAPGWTDPALRPLRMHLFDTEQSLQAMAASVAVCAQWRSQMPPALLNLAAQMPAGLKAALLEPHVAERTEALALTGGQLVEQARAAVNDALRPALAGLAGLAGASIRTAHSMQAIRALLAQAGAASSAAAGRVPQRQAAPPPAPPAPASTAPASTAPAQQGALHPTTILGIQAVVACGLTMLIGAWLDLNHAYWAFWTAFIVVAGPAGESLQKLIYRVIGVILGSLFGTLLAVLAAGNLFLLALLGLLAMMLALYMRVINYAWMAFWVTTFVGVLYNVEGEPLRTVLVFRPLDTVIGACVAALVVLFVLPIHVRDKFRAALVGLLKTTDAYLETIAHSLGKPDAQAAVSAAAMQTAGAYEAAAKMFQAMLLESSPFLHAQGSAAHTSMVRQLYSEVENFARFTRDGAEEMQVEEVARIQTMTETIHANIGALEQIAGGQFAAMQRLQWDKTRWAGPAAEGTMEGAAADAAIQDTASPSGLPVGLRAEIALGRINQTLLQLGDTLGSTSGENRR